MVFNQIYYSVPYLQPVPQPSAVYDPDTDVQADDFCDEDVAPQLSSSPTYCIKAVNPATEELLGYVKAHTASDIPVVIEKARAAQKVWSRSTFKQRRLVLQTLANYVLYEQKSLCQISMRDTGKTMVEASLGEIIPTLEKLRWLNAEGEAALKPSHRTVGPMTMHKAALVCYQPLGVIVAIAPWNYPFHNLMNPVSAALFSGNAVVVKASEHAVWSSVHFARVVRRALAVCGVDPDLMQCVVGGSEVGQSLVEAQVDKIFFTGSTAVGRKVAVTAAQRLTPTCLELGGKDAFVICDDANVTHAMTIGLRGVFQNAGQNCIGVERVFVHRDIKQKVTQLAVEQVGKIRLGVDMGAMTMGEQAVDNIQALVDDALDKGAKLLIGGKRGNVNDKGWYYEPTVLTGLTKKMKIANEEVFGPVMCIYEWKDDEDLIAQVNDCDFGLGCSVFTADKNRAEVLMTRLRVGMCNVNDFATSYLCQSMPFGGTKQSGSDRFAGIEGLRGCCIPMSTTRDRFPGIKTDVPKALQYPVSANAAELTAEINDLMYGKGILGRIDNIRNIVGMLIFQSWRPRCVGSG